MNEHPTAGHTADPVCMVIFGASGDLTKRKLIPALCNLAQNNLLARQFAVIGFAYQQMTTEEFRKQLTEDIKQFATEPVDPAVWDWLAQRVSSIQGHFPPPTPLHTLKLPNE